MDTLLRTLADGQQHSPTLLLAGLIDLVRPANPADSAQAIKNVRALSYLLEQHPDYRANLRRGLLQQLGSTRQIQLYTDVGILSNEGFFSSMKTRIGERLLPPPRNLDYLKDVFSQLFRDKRDYQWVQALPQAVCGDFWCALHWEEESDSEALSHTRWQLLEAVQVLSSRIVAIGLEPELVRVHPDIERFESPFLHLNAEVFRFVEGQRDAATDGGIADDDEKHILVLLEQCEGIVQRIRKNASRYGISVSLTYHLQRLRQHIHRLRQVLTLLTPDYDPVADPTLFRLLGELVRADNRRHKLSDLLTSNIELLALQVTEHAGQRGEHYIAESRKEWLDMAQAAMGAGLIVGFMALIKLSLAQAHLPLLLEGMAFGLNYALGFMLIQLLRFTVATKQPAMTAARLAAAIHTPNGGKAQLTELTELVVSVLRTQFVAIVGNVLMAIPVAWAIAEGWKQLFGAQAVSVAKAQHLLQDLDPLASLSLFHAAIAGVYLFLSGLIAGYHDNLAIYRRIPERLAALPWLNRLLGERRTRCVAQYVEHNLGALAGNFYFGLFLGLTGTVGVLLGLPIDIRHITFASANLAFAAVGLDYLMSWQTLAWSVLGIGLIGLLNLLVSFNLALWVALRSRKLTLRDALPLLPAVGRHFLRRPLDFFWPPRRPAPEDEAVAEALEPSQR
ncbi:MAG: site-specific recombinase [Pseudogulbenkiania sp.]|nr:site-specific recombinase [Pseudogulbenkiania sp.]